MRNGSGSNYLDASILVAVLTVEAFSERADRFVRDHPSGVIISDFAAAEFASAIARRVGMREVTVDDARSDLSAFDSWAARSVQLIEVTAADVALATAFLRRLDLTLRTPDAIHIAIAQRINATLVTFDQRMSESARALGMAVATP
jgi:predicted nucleic acid-binding protein